MPDSLPDVWLRGPVVRVPAPLMPVAHALLQAVEDLERVTAELDRAKLWTAPGGAASIGFHLRHLTGSTERLFTYARGEALSDEQRSRLSAEKAPGDEDAAMLLEDLRRVVEEALEQLRSTPVERLADGREVGRARLPSTVLGLLFHAAEHAQRHTGQVITTAKILHG